MQREIKFRGKRKDNGEWVISTSIINEHGCVYLKHPKQSGHWIEVIPETVGQFTGLLDKTGKEIYEGDAIQIDWGIDVGLAEIRYCDSEFGFNYISRGCKEPGNPLFEIKDKSIEIIGKIHEHTIETIVKKS